MDSSQNRLLCLRTTRIIISLLLLLVSSLSHQRFMAEGRAISKLLETTQQKGNEEDKTMKIQIGSSPPRCERRCNSCTHCEAVQVPITAQTQNHRRAHYSSVSSLRIAYSREDDISNYKPMSWKCKCGNLIFNP